MNIPFVGPTYAGRSGNIDASRSVNFYPETNAAGAKQPMSLVGTPGTLLWASLGALPIRGMHVMSGVLYVVAGGRLYSVTAAGIVSPALGLLTTSTGRVLMADNGAGDSGVGGNQLMIVDGANGYIYNTATGVFSECAGGGFPSAGAASLTYIDGYFIAAAQGSMNVCASDLYDGTTWNALAQSPVSAAPDAVRALANLHQQLWIIKEYTSEVWYDAGTPTSQGFPFLRVPGAVIDYGTPAPYSVARGNDSLFFLASQRNNDGGEFVGVVSLYGYAPQIVSPPQVAYRMGLYPTLADAFGYCYSEGGHTFYVLTFPAGNATWVFDASTAMWHERSTWRSAPYTVGRHVGNCYAAFAGAHLVGDWQSGNIYAMRSDVYTDNGLPLVSVRTAQHIFDPNDLSTLFIRRLTVDMETGVGDAATGFAPACALSWSDDGGHRWSGEYAASMGAAGRYKTRAVWRRLGSFRDRIFRIAISDPVKRVIIGASIE
jgi:hypothetical protein